VTPSDDRDPFTRAVDEYPRTMHYIAVIVTVLLVMQLYELVRP